MSCVKVRQDASVEIVIGFCYYIRSQQDDKVNFWCKKLLIINLGRITSKKLMKSCCCLFSHFGHLHFNYCTQCIENNVLYKHCSLKSNWKIVLRKNNLSLLSFMLKHCLFFAKVVEETDKPQYSIPVKYTSSLFYCACGHIKINIGNTL